MTQDRNRVCPVERASSLDNGIRRWLQNPRRILSPFIAEGMKVLDVGCGPGFFSVALADLVGDSGHVISADLQEGMLGVLASKIRGTLLEGRISLVQCSTSDINVSDSVDFVLAFYMVHEVPDKPSLFRQLRALLKPGGRFLLVEPKLFHVSRKEFVATLKTAEEAGFSISDGPSLLFSWSAILSISR